MKRSAVRRILFSLALIAISLFAKTSKEYDVCMKNATSTIDFLQCMDRENERLEQLIRKRAEKLKACIPPKRRGEVENMDSAWWEYKEAKCNLYVGASGGTGDTEDAMDCLVNEASDYADTLQDFIDTYCSEEE